MVVLETQAALQPHRKRAEQLVQRTAQRLDDDPHPPHEVAVAEVLQVGPSESIGEVVRCATGAGAPMPQPPPSGLVAVL
eukprot:6809001-Heterocapsa_arctica.AAC.1